MELKGIEKETLTGDNKSRLEFKSRLAHQRDSRKAVSFFVSRWSLKRLKPPVFHEKRKTRGFLHFVGNSHLFATVVIYFADFGRRHVGADGGVKENKEILKIMSPS